MRRIISLEKLHVVFDNKGSSTSSYLSERFNNAKLDFAFNAYAAKGNEDLINYIAKNKSAIGVLGVSWISDKDELNVQDFLKKIKVVALAPPDSAKGAGDFYKPYQAYIALKYYPLHREIYMLNVEGKSGLGTGFGSFLAGDKGQRIILKSALVPATAPLRIMEFKQ